MVSDMSMWDMEELRRVVALGGGLLVIEDDVVYIIDVASGWKIIWRDGELYTLEGRRLIDAFNDLFAAISELAFSITDGIRRVMDELMAVPEIREYAEGLAALKAETEAELANIHAEADEARRRSKADVDKKRKAMMKTRGKL